jgi:hypothetical protein
MIASIQPHFANRSYPTQVQQRGSVNQTCLIGFRPRAEKPESKSIFHGIFMVSSGFYACGAAATLTAVNVVKKY